MTTMNTRIQKKRVASRRATAMWMMPLLFLRTATALSSSSSSSPVKPYGTAWIDYSAANEYLDEQYQDKIANPYFPQTRQEEDVYNGRNGVLVPPPPPPSSDSQDDNDAHLSLAKPSLETCGFCLSSLPAPDLKDWNNKAQLRECYLPILRRHFQTEFGDNIRHLLFYNPMARGEALDANRQDLTSHELPTSPTQSKAHMDNDWNASDMNRVVGLVQKQSLDYYDKEEEFPEKKLRQDVQDGYRYMVINCWRNIGATPIQRAPLGLYATRYSQPLQCFPAQQPDFSRSDWYVFPQMTNDECLLFKQFDRDNRYISDIWHCALHSLTQQDTTADLRKSFDIRAFVVLNEKVPAKHDRYGSNRLEPKYKTAEEHQAATS